VDGERTVQVMQELPAARLVIVPGYAPVFWTDVIKDHTKQLGSALFDFWTSRSIGASRKLPALRPGEGEVAEVSYQIRGSGEPLVLLPLGLAPSGWEPLVAQLSEHFCTIVLGGAELGILPALEHRGRSASYRRLIRNLFAEIELKPGERILDVGCGSGVVDRWVVQQTNGQNLLWGVDINPYLLQEARALARKEQVDHLLVFQEGNAEALPFPTDHFDVTFSTTVMEEVNADQMLAELIRVTKPGGRIGVVVRALDIPYTLNVPVRKELKASFEFPEWHGDGEACASASLYRRFRNAQLINPRLWPQLVSFDNPDGVVERFMLGGLLTQLSAEELNEYQSALNQATAEGTFFITWPHHCAVGTKPLA
jgi:SAM-dependent methyltransferase